LRAVVVRLWTASSFSFSLLRLPQGLAAGDEDSERRMKILRLGNEREKMIKISFVSFLSSTFYICFSCLPSAFALTASHPGPRAKSKVSQHTQRKNRRMPEEERDALFVWLSKAIPFL